MSESENEIPLISHIKELRSRLLYSLIALIICTIIAGIFNKFIIEQLVLLPAEKSGLILQNLRVFGQPILYFKIVFVAGLILASPVILFQIWLFVKPALHKHEIKWSRSIAIFTAICFLSGVVFSYLVIMPTMLNFASSFGTKLINNQIDVNYYLSFLIMLLLSMGILFELPILTYILSRAGIVTHKTMLKYWRHSLIAILVVAAVLTPTPDPISQLIFAAPLCVLYAISIFVAKSAEKKPSLD
jgi:sec-independent protein translocase protein TatC